MRRAPWALVSLSLTVACGSSDEGGALGGGGTAGGGATDAGPGGASAGGGAGAGGASGVGGGGVSARPSTGCALSERPPADERRTLQHATGERLFDVHVPPSYQPGHPVPLLVNLHGLTPVVGDTAAVAQANISRMKLTSDAEGFVVVHPQGLVENRSASWNAGACCSPDTTRDDVGFLVAMLDEIEARYCIDRARVYASGLSNGGMMSHRLACEVSERFAAVAPVAARMTVPACAPSRAISVIAFHGTADRLVPYESGLQAAQGWAALHGCASGPAETFRNGDSHCDTWRGCREGAEVVFCTVDDGGHTWPGGNELPAFGKTTRDLEANAALWEFFQRHPLP